MLAAAERMNDVSGSRFCVSGVGTQMITAPTSRTASKSVVADEQLVAHERRRARRRHVADVGARRP